MKEKISLLSIRLETLTIFRNILEDNVIKRLKKLLWLVDYGENLAEVLSAYSQFTHALYAHSSNLSSYMSDVVLNDENFYIKGRAQGEKFSPLIENCLVEELLFFEKLSQVSSSHIQKEIDYCGFLPSWENSKVEIKKVYMNKLENINKSGYGLLAKHSTFSLKHGSLCPVKNSTHQSLDELYGYERERDLIIKNTEALLQGTGSNMLLYGDAGTGKSSTLKAVCYKYKDQGLRLIEVKKNQLYDLPSLLEELSSNPLKFVLFIDDLSFSSGDSNFSTLKAILEGSVHTFGKNIAIYATSNRRHLFREFASDRNGDDLHVNDTLQETMSLAARFGLTVVFEQPSKEEYLSIVDRLAEEYGFLMPAKELHEKAEAHAIRNNGRSPRVAKQFIQLAKIGI